MLDYAQAEQESAVPRLHTRLRGRDTDAGFNVGLLWHPAVSSIPSASLTAAPPTWISNGHASDTLDGAAGSNTSRPRLNYHLPQTVAFGYSYRPNKNWNFEADADWTDWTSLRDLTITTVPAEVLPFNWKPSTLYEFGATRYFGNGWRASAGYMFSENSVPSSSFDALIADSDRHLFSIGVGKTYRHLSWDASYQLGIGPSRSVAGDPPYNGNYEFFSNALSINIGWHF